MITKRTNRENIYEGIHSNTTTITHLKQRKLKFVISYDFRAGNILLYRAFRSVEGVIVRKRELDEVRWQHKSEKERILLHKIDNSHINIGINCYFFHMKTRRSSQKLSIDIDIYQYIIELKILISLEINEIPNSYNRLNLFLWKKLDR